ncbi:hypothetical protein N6H14_28455 [Paenibacillus sp. CC-CFT747]|nr:hypothetical protein N6H14_28455 [Paenibacillus sp. CC-CFT747]
MPAYRSDRWFSFINGTFFIVLCLTMISPLIHLAAVSLSEARYANAKLVYFWPKGWNTEVYSMILGMDNLWRAMGVSVYITVLGTLISLVLTSTIAYALSRPSMPGEKSCFAGLSSPLFSPRLSSRTTYWFVLSEWRTPCGRS